MPVSIAACTRWPTVWDANANQICVYRIVETCSSAGRLDGARSKIGNVVCCVLDGQLYTLVLQVNLVRALGLTPQHGKNADPYVTFTLQDSDPAREQDIVMQARLA